MGFRELEVDLNNMSISELGRELLKKNSKFSTIFNNDGGIKPGYLLLVNDVDHRILGDKYKISKDDVIIILPVSHGG